jgi:enoyl-CoA hydratase/carnithine racemase
VPILTLSVTLSTEGQGRAPNEKERTMTYDNLVGLRVAVADGVATVTLDHPPFNLMDGTMLASLRAFAHRVRDDADVRVVVFDSADEEFFSAHGDMHFLTDLEALPTALQAFADAAPGVEVAPDLNPLEALNVELRTLPQVTIGKLSGLARGGGNEFLTYLDMRFAAIGRSGQAQPETAQDILPGGGGTVNLPRLLGRARALEVILGGELMDAELAERYGLVNRALPADEIDAFVTDLARRIAKLRPEVVAAIKQVVEASVPSAPVEAYQLEGRAGMGIYVPGVTEFALRQLAAGVQSDRDVERNLEDTLRSL